MLQTPPTPAAARAAPGAGAAAATGPGPEPAVAAPGVGEIKPQWLTLLLSRTGKGGSDQAACHDEPDRITSRINVRILMDKKG